jgi:hypothetical protein
MIDPQLVLLLLSLCNSSMRNALNVLRDNTMILCRVGRAFSHKWCQCVAIITSVTREQRTQCSVVRGHATAMHCR